MKGFLRRLGFALFWSGVPIVSAAPMVEKAWWFTTANQLTIDLKCVPGTEPDWNAATLRLVRVGDPASVVQARFTSERVSLEPETGVYRAKIGPLDVAAWLPVSPALYEATLELADAAGRKETLSQRIGFRSFETRDGQVRLNGNPIFLRGLAINPPGRGIPKALEESRAFAEDYVKFMLRHHVNIIRIPDDETWYDVCDELGMMVFGGNYAGSTIVRETKEDDELGKRGPANDHAAAAQWYRETKFHPVSHHPSLVVYALSNETPYQGVLGDAWHAFLSDMYARLRRWDPTRLYIANAGYGSGRTGDICDLHRYWGWYHSTPYTFLHLRDAPSVTFPERVQPLMFTECVGNYGGPDGRVNLSPNNKNPVAQLNWTGHAPTGEQAQLFHEHQSFTFRQATELFRRLRFANHELSGVFPFTILFHNWHAISDFDEMKPRPVVDQMAASYAPVLLSWELYTTQIYAGSVLKPIIHLVNDADDFSDLRDVVVHYELRDAAETAVATGELRVAHLGYYQTARHPVALPVPAALPSGTYRLVGSIEQQGRILSENRVEVFVASTSYVRSGPAPVRPVRLFDPAGPTRAAFTKLGLAHTIAGLDADFTSSDVPLVIGERALPFLNEKQVGSVKEFAVRGGRVLLLRQSPSAIETLNRLLPAEVRLPTAELDDPDYPTPSRAEARQGMNINPERPDHPVFTGIDRRRLRSWSDYTGWDDTKPGLPAVHPVSDSFILCNKADVAFTAVLANQHLGLECIGLAEFFAGQGSILFSGFDLAARAGLDPVADRLLLNLVRYTANEEGHDAHVLIESPIVWGEYETERGLLTGINSGLMLNSRPALTESYRGIPILIHKDGHQFAGRPGGWNSRPGIQYVPYGRRPFGPYVHNPVYGIPAPENRETPLGEGRFWCRVPPGKTKVVHRISNPSMEAVEIRIAANGHEVAVALSPQSVQIVEVPLAAGTDEVDNVIRGDRRLVLLETAFE